VRISVIFSRLALIVVPVLAGCGGSGSPSYTTMAKDYPPATTAFIGIDAKQLVRDADRVGSCSVDTVNGQAARGAALDHLGTGSFQGWVGDRASGTVPSVVKVILIGATDYAVSAKTGLRRPDVASVTKVPAFVGSGFKVVADMSAVPIGDYRVALAYKIGDEKVICGTDASLSVQ
jgi:hypothetical protein